MIFISSCSLNNLGMGTMPGMIMCGLAGMSHENYICPTPKLRTVARLY